MKFYNFIIRYRLILSIIGVILGLILELFLKSGFWSVFPLYFVALIGIVTEFIIGPLRLIQEPMEKGNIEEVEKIIKSIKFPGLLIKPIRSTYYTILGNLSMMKKDFNTAEKHLRKSSSLGSPLAEAEGATKLQLGMVAFQKGNIKEAEQMMKAALRLGVQDNESKSLAYLMLCQIYVQKNEFRFAKEQFRKAEACKPKSEQVLEQIKQIKKYLARVPG
ncbi:MAG: hypothetical protein ORN85_08675 [Sediminibacterium sp.]|nr:hypothetical protein [Sediminibacterium sp.]